MAEIAHRGSTVALRWNADPTLYAPARYRRPCTYHAYIPDPLAGWSPGLGGELAGVVSDAEVRILALNGTAAPALAPLARLLLRTESIASSKVEGLQVDARALARAEARQAVGQRIGPDAAEVLANIDAMRAAVAAASVAGGEAGADITSDDLLELHRVLLAGSAPRIAGRIRTTQNWIGGNDFNPCGADFVPPPPEHVPALLRDLARFCSDDTLPPLVQAAIAHAQFETIHPFDDGNGRTGRALVQAILRRRGLAPSYVPPVSVILAAHRDRYIDGLTAYRAGDVAGWIELFAVAAARAAGLASAYLAEVRDLQERWRDQLRAAGAPRADAAAWAVIDLLPGHPVVTFPVALAASGRNRMSVNAALARLEAAGVLLPLGSGARNRAWEAAGLLDLLGRLEDGLPAR